jgi:hypothetical protein
MLVADVKLAGTAGVGVGSGLLVLLVLLDVVENTEVLPDSSKALISASNCSRTDLAAGLAGLWRQSVMFALAALYSAADSWRASI